MAETVIPLFNALYEAVRVGAMDKLMETMKSLQPFLDSGDIDIPATLKSEGNPLKDTNLIILCCKFGQLGILDYILSNSKPFIDSLYNGRPTVANVLSPLDRDGEGHNAFYYAIRSNNVGIVVLLCKKWLPSFDESVACNDSLLSKAYEELKLRNVGLTEAMEFFVVSEITDSRFTSNNDDPPAASFRNDVLGKIDWLLNNIESLKAIEVDSQFLLLAKCIAQSIHILKYQLKATYDKLPWEELEFSLIIYVSSRLHYLEKSIIPSVAITKETLLSQLGYFAAILKGLSLHDVLDSNEFPHMSRDEIVPKIIKNSPELVLLYESYEKVRDVYSLEKIEEYLELSHSVNHEEKEGQLAIIRVLHVLGDYLKNTLDNCKLSSAMSRVILSALPRNTREIVIDLRNTVSHANSLKKRLEIEENSPDFFRDVQNDLKALSLIVSRILNNEKQRIIVDSLENISKSDDIQEFSELVKRIKYAQKCIDAENFELFEEEKILTLITELETAISTPNMFGRIRQLFDVVRKNLAEDSETDLPSSMLVVSGAAALQLFDNLDLDRKLYVCDLPSIKNMATATLRGLSPTSFMKKISKVQRFVKDLHKNIKRKTCGHNFSTSDEEKARRLLFEISFTASNKIQDVLCFDVEPVIDSIESSEVILLETDREKYLKSKLSTLKRLVGSEWKSAYFLKESKQLKLAIEILLLDILSISEDDKRESDNKVLCVEYNTPVLIGKYLKNFLAHDSALLDILSPDTTIAIQSYVILLLKGETLSDSRKIGKLPCDDIYKAKEKLNGDMKIVTQQYKLFCALEKGDTQTSLALIKSGADALGRSNSHESTLHFAAKSLNMELAKFILKQNVKADSVDIEGETALHVAAAHGNVAFVEHLVVNVADVDLEQKDKKGRTCLHLAVKHGETETVVLLIKLGADISSMDGDMRPPVIMSIENNSVGVLDTFLERGTYTFGWGIIGRLTPLHTAAKYNRVDIIKLLLKKGVHVDIRNDLNITPLLVATDNGCVEAAEILIKAGANVNANYGGFLTSLHIAADKGHTALAALLLQNGADADPANNADTPIHYAALNGQLEVIKLLIKHTVSIDRRNIWGCAPLHIAAVLGHVEVAKTLLEAGVDIESRDTRGSTALHLSAWNGCLEVTKLLIEKGAHLNAADPFTGTALHLAARGRHDEIGKELVNSGGDINATRDTDGCTPLHVAIEKGANSLVKLLLERGANPDTKDKGGTAPIHFGSLLGNVDGVSYLIKYKCNVNVRGFAGVTPLYMSATDGCCEVAELLLKGGAEVNTMCQRGMTPLFAAVDNEHLQMAKLLIRYGANINLGKPAPVESAIQNNSIELLEYLVRQGADFSKDDLLSKLVYCGFSECARFLLENGYPANTLCYEDRSVLQVAVEKGFLNILRDLILHGANVNSVDLFNFTPLHYAVMTNNLEVVEVLLSNGADIHSKTMNGSTALRVAADFGDRNIVELLLAKGADPLEKDGNAESPLSRAIKRSDLQIVEAMFQSKRISKNVRLFNTMTPLDLASSHSFDIVKFLVSNDFVPDLVGDNDNLKPIHWACLGGKKETAEYFLNSGVSVNETSCEKRTPLHYAALREHHHVVKYLVSQGADIHVKDFRNDTPLELGRKNEDIAALLLKNGALFNEDVPYYLTATYYTNVVLLLLAVKDNDLREVKQIIEAGTFLNAISSSSGSALHFASFKGYHDIVQLLLENNANVNVTASKACTPLHYATKYSHENIVLELLFHGAVYNAITDGGKTPLRLATDANIKELLSVIEKCFDLVEKGDVTVESTIENLGSQNGRYLNALIKTKNRNNQDIFQVANFYKYPRPNELFEVCHADYIKIDSSGLSGRDLDEEALAKMKSLFKEKQEWLANRNTPSASSVCQDINNVLLSLEEYENAMKQAKQENCGTPLEQPSGVIAAVLKGDMNLLKEALQRGGNVNETDSNGRTALHYAVDRVDERCVKFLLQNGADVTHVSHKGNTALHTAVNKQSPNIVKILLEFAVNNRKLDFINKPTLAKGNTALHVAAKSGNLDVLKILLKYGATYEIENRDGEKPKDLSSNVEIVQLFDLLSEMFADAETGNFRVVERMKSMEKEDVSAVAGARNLGGRTILQVAIGYQNQNISSNLLKIIQAANA